MRKKKLTFDELELLRLIWRQARGLDSRVLTTKMVALKKTAATCIKLGLVAYGNGRFSHRLFLTKEGKAAF